MRDLLLLSMACLLSCGAPMPGDEGADGKDGAAGERGAQGPPGPAGKDAVQGGSRLRPLWLVGADGSRQAFTNAFYDTQLNERCFLQGMPGAPPEAMERVCAPLNFDRAQAGRYVRFVVE